MGTNAYFQMIHRKNQTLLKVFPPSEGGEMFPVEDVIRYLDAINFPTYNTAELNQYIKRENFSSAYLLAKQEVMAESEKCLVEIRELGESAVGRFYPPSEGGAKITKDEILSDLKLAGVVHGIQEKVIDEFLKKPEYCRDYVLAEATPPVQGHDALVEYHFDVNTAAKPKLNEDGSVDFHHLGNIKPVQKGEKIATLTPADFGKPGIRVTGEPLPPNKVKNNVVRHGVNISVSEDGRELYSQVAGHVTLVADFIMVSDVYDVPANVDASTGDIEYKGTVNVVGNVNTGYAIKADGDIIVNGVVEGANLVAGGNIVLKRGMQGMSRGTLEAKGNITAKFIENSEVKCDGTLMCDAVLHSDAECKGEISVLGKKGLINGGHIRSFTNISATHLGSAMGTSTVVEVMSDVEQVKMLNDTKEKIRETEEALVKMDKVLVAIKKALKTGKPLTPQQTQYLKLAAVSKPKLKREVTSMEARCEDLQKTIETNRKACVRVEKSVNPGVKIVIKEMSKIINDNVSSCRFILEGADVKAVGIYG